MCTAFVDLNNFLKCKVMQGGNREAVYVLENISPAIGAGCSTSREAPAGDRYNDPGNFSAAMDDRCNDEGYDLLVVIYELLVWLKPDRGAALLGRMPGGNNKWNGVRAVGASSAAIWVEWKEGILASLGNKWVGEMRGRGKVKDQFLAVEGEAGRRSSMVGRDTA